MTQSTAMFFPTFWNIDNEIGRLRKFIAKNPCFRIKAMFAMVQSFLGMIYKWNFLNPIQDGLFWGCSRMGSKMPPLQNLWHISYNNETWYNYTLLKEYPQNIWITWHSPWVLLTSAFLYQKSENIAISRNIDSIWVHNFCFNFF